jgi:hypothetical protein
LQPAKGVISRRRTWNGSKYSEVIAKPSLISSIHIRVCYHLRIIEGEAPIAAWIYIWYSHIQVTSRKIECSGRVQSIDVNALNLCRGIGKFRTGCERIDSSSYEQWFCQVCPCKERVAILANSVVKDVNSGPRTYLKCEQGRCSRIRYSAMRICLHPTHKIQYKKGKQSHKLGGAR